VSALLDLMRDSDAEPRVGRRGAGADRPADLAAAGGLVPLLHDPVASVRLAAVQALGQLGQSARVALPR